MEEKFEQITAIIITLAIYIAGMSIAIATFTSEEVKKNEIYEKIMRKEFGQIFQNYNEYLLYKIEKGEKENR